VIKRAHTRGNELLLYHSAAEDTVVTVGLTYCGNQGKIYKQVTPSLDLSGISLVEAPGCACAAREGE